MLNYWIMMNNPTKEGFSTTRPFVAREIVRLAVKEVTNAGLLYGWSDVFVQQFLIICAQYPNALSHHRCAVPCQFRKVKDDTLDVVTGC